MAKQTGATSTLDYTQSATLQFTIPSALDFGCESAACGARVQAMQQSAARATGELACPARPVGGGRDGVR